jgi:hypothetical protein
MVRDYPGRFGMFAALPMPDIGGTLREIEYSFDTLHADGIGIFSGIRDKYPGIRFLNPSGKNSIGGRQSSSSIRRFHIAATTISSRSGRADGRV